MKRETRTTKQIKASDLDAESEYLIWSHEHGAWWRPQRAGYSLSVEGAGRYTREEAIKICAHAREGFADLKTPPNEIPVRVEDLLECRAEFLRVFERQ